MSSRLALSNKEHKVEEIRKLVKKYKVIGVADLYKVRAAQLQELKRKLEDSAYLRAIKNNTIKRAISGCQTKHNMEGLERYLSGSNIFLFTEINPFRLAIILKKSRVRTTAKAGDVAADDVIVPAGNTGLAPGPIISQLSGVGLATRIEAGSVWINRKTIVAKRGENITEGLANVLSKLGIKSVDVGLIMKVAYDDGHIITGEEMLVDLEKVANRIKEAQDQVLNVSINTIYPLPETITFLLQIPHHEAVKLALNAGITNPETIGFFIRKAHAEMLSLSTRLNMERVKEI